jgi:hypothetical protein
MLGKVMQVALGVAALGGSTVGGAAVAGAATSSTTSSRQLVQRHGGSRGVAGAHRRPEPAADTHLDSRARRSLGPWLDLKR